MQNGGSMNSKILILLQSNNFTFNSKLNRYVRCFTSKTRISNIIVTDTYIEYNSRECNSKELDISGKIEYTDFDDFINKFIDTIELIK
jgi:hypothetical protein